MKILVFLASKYLERKGFVVFKEPTFCDRVSLNKILALVAHRSTLLGVQIKALSDSLTMISNDVEVNK